MPSNTDDGIVEKVARAICNADAVKCDCNLPGGFCADMQRRAIAAIEAYTAHLRDKGMVVVPGGLAADIGVYVTHLTADETDAKVVSTSSVQSEAEIVERGALRELERKKK